MKNFYLSWKFCTLTITVFGKECLRNVLNTSRRRVNKSSLTWWYVLKTSWIYLCKTSWRCLEDISTTSWRRLENVLETFMQDVLKTSWKRLEDILKTYGQDEYIGLDQDVVKTSSENVRLRRPYSSWSRRLKDVMKTFSKDENIRCLQDIVIKPMLAGIMYHQAVSFSRSQEQK